MSSSWSRIRAIIIPAASFTCLNYGPLSHVDMSSSWSRIRAIIIPAASFTCLNYGPLSH
ncbi:hypothetical protein DPMN_021012, partial [Dreissena polymorpha]